MRFLRILPAVWAMISCSFSSLTRNVALGSSSVTVPGNSSSSSFDIQHPLEIWRENGQKARRNQVAAKLNRAGKGRKALISRGNSIRGSVDQQVFDGRDDADGLHHLLGFLG